MATCDHPDHARVHPRGAPDGVHCLQRDFRSGTRCAADGTALMAVKLQKLPGRPDELGMYRLTGDLGELDGPGRRVVRDVEAVRIQGPPDALAVFAAFPDLRRLSLGGVDGMRLDPLAGLGLDSLTISGGRELDLAPLSEFAGLRELWLLGLERCRVPDRLALPSTLRSLFLASQSARPEPDIVAALLRNLQWQALRDLAELDIRARVGRLRVDLGFLRELGRLERLDLLGVTHDASNPSPLEPPFDGLSRKLSWLRLEGDDPEPLTAALNNYLPSRCAAVLPLLDDGEDSAVADGEWAVIEPEPGDDDPAWLTYGSLADAYDFEIEHDAARQAKARLRAADPQRAKRIEFDGEADGTGIAGGPRVGAADPRVDLGQRVTDSGRRRRHRGAPGHRLCAASREALPVRTLRSHPRVRLSRA